MTIQNLSPEQAMAALYALALFVESGKHPAHEGAARAAYRSLFATLTGRPEVHADLPVARVPQRGARHE